MAQPGRLEGSYDEQGNYHFHEANAEHGPPLTPAPDMDEIGSTGQTMYGPLAIEEYKAELRGLQGIKVYDKMRRSDAQVRGTLRLVKAPLTAAQWYIEPGGDSAEDVMAAEFVEWNMQAMHHSWMTFLWEALYMLDYGYYSFEKVYETSPWRPQAKNARERTVVKWQKFAPRHPMTVYEWKFDDVGVPLGFWQQTMHGDAFQTDWIPYNKALVFTLDQEAGDPTGTSILRSSYQNWYYKTNLYKVDAIQKERHGIGIPVVRLPPGFTQGDKLVAGEMGRNLRTNEKAHIVLPPGWDISMMPMNTNLVNVMDSIEHHGRMIAYNVLTQFLELGSTDSGSRAVGGTQVEVFVKALSYIADIVRGVLNQYAIPQLIDYNFQVDRYPTLKVRRIGENADWRAFSVALRNLVEPGLITPTPELEAWLSDQMDLPLPTKEAMDRPVEERIKKSNTPDPNNPSDGNRGGGQPPNGQNADGSRQGSITGGPKE